MSMGTFFSQAKSMVSKNPRQRLIPKILEDEQGLAGLTWLLFRSVDRSVSKGYLPWMPDFVVGTVVALGPKSRCKCKYLQ